MARSALYRGAVMHARTDEHARRTFRYPVYVASLDLTELAALDRDLRWFSHGGTNLFALHDRDYEAGPNEESCYCDQEIAHPSSPPLGRAGCSDPVAARLVAHPAEVRQLLTGFP